MTAPRFPKAPRWWWWIGGWTAVGLVVRVATVLGRLHRTPGGDAYFYHGEANLLVTGHGFIHPLLYNAFHRSVPTAAFPPGFTFLLAAVAVIGFKSFLAQRLWCCVIGAAAVCTAALVGRRMAGPRAGVIAAALVALYPNIWMSDELALSECVTPLVVTLVLLAAYRFRDAPGVGRAVWLGVAIGVAAIVRDELALLGILVAAPLVLRARPLAPRMRVGAFGATAAAALMVVGPWVGYNLTRFQNPVFISSGLGVTLASANCPILYSGPFEGYWNQHCAEDVAVPATADESVQGAGYQRAALHFIGQHDDRLLPVVAARLGRAFGFFHPLQQLQLDSGIETRPYHWALVGLLAYYMLLGASIGGMAVLRSRHVPVWPVVAVGVNVAVSVVLTFGNTRYRTAFEVSLAILSAVYLDWLWSHLGQVRRDRKQAPIGDPVLVSSGSSGGIG